MSEVAMEPMASIKSMLEEIKAMQKESNELGATILCAIKPCEKMAKPPEFPSNCMMDGVEEIRERSFMIRNQLEAIRQILFG